MTNDLISQNTRISRSSLPTSHPWIIHTNPDIQTSSSQFIELAGSIGDGKRALKSRHKFSTTPYANKTLQPPLKRQNKQSFKHANKPASPSPNSLCVSPKVLPPRQLSPPVGCRTSVTIRIIYYLSGLSGASCTGSPRQTRASHSRNQLEVHWTHFDDDRPPLPR